MMAGWPCGLVTCEHAPDAHAGIDHHRHRADFEKSENQFEKLEAGPHHQDRAVAAADAGVLKAVRQAVGCLVELSKVRWA